jgi:hypothetical protein
MMNPEGSVDKVAIDSGELLWSSESAARPLALYGDVLLAQSENAEAPGFEVVSLDALNGRDLQSTFRLELPEGVRANIDDGMGFSFKARGMIRDGQPLVLWEHTETYVKGVAPKSDEPLERSQLSAYRLDLASDRATAIDPALMSEAAPTLPAAARDWAISTPGAAGAFPAGAVIAGTQLENDGARARIILKRWDSGSGFPLPDVELFRGEHVLRFESADKRHLLVAERLAPGDFEEYEWTIFSLETGELLGRLRHHQSHAWFLVSGNALIFESTPFGRLVDDSWVEKPRALGAALLGSGAIVWTRPLRDTSYTGSFPP